MALTDEVPTATAPARRGAGLLVRATPTPRATDLDVLVGEHVRTVSVPGRADAEAAARLLRLFRHVSSVRIDLDAADAHCALRGVRHRAPVTQSIGLRAALGLAARGVPATITLGADG